MTTVETVSWFPFKDIRDRALEGAKVERGFFLFVLTLVLAFLITSAATNVVQSKSSDVVLTMWEVRETYGSNTWISSVERLSKGGCSAGASRFQFLEAVMCISLVICCINIYLMVMEYVEKPVIRRSALICFVITFLSVGVTWAVSFFFMYSTICSSGGRGTLNYSPAAHGFVFGASFATLSCAFGLLGFCILIFLVRRIHDKHQERRELNYLENKRRRKQEELDALGEEEVVEMEAIGEGAENNINDGGAAAVAEALRRARLEGSVNDINTDRRTSVAKSVDSADSVALAAGEGMDLGYSASAAVTIDSPPKNRRQKVTAAGSPMVTTPPCAAVGVGNKNQKRSDFTSPTSVTPVSVKDFSSHSGGPRHNSTSSATPTSPSATGGSKMRAVFTTTNRNQPKRDNESSDSPPTSSRRRRESELSIQSNTDQVNRFSPIPNQSMTFNHHSHDHDDTDVGGSSFSKPPRPPGSGNDGLRASPSNFYRLQQPSRSSIAYTESSADRSSAVLPSPMGGRPHRTVIDSSAAASDMNTTALFERPVSRQPDAPMGMSSSITRNFHGSRSFQEVGETSLRRKRSKSIMFLDDNEQYTPRGAFADAEGSNPVSPIILPRKGSGGGGGSFSLSPAPRGPTAQQPSPSTKLFSPRPGSGPPRKGGAMAAAPASRPDSASQVATRPPSANAGTNNYNSNTARETSYSSAEGVPDEETIVLAEEAVPSAAFQRPITPQKAPVNGPAATHFPRNLAPLTLSQPPTASAPPAKSDPANKRPAHLKLQEEEGLFDFNDGDFE